jgi:CxxC motif-containing protein (DUF1111 family)
MRCGRRLGFWLTPAIFGAAAFNVAGSDALFGPAYPLDAIEQQRFRAGAQALSLEWVVSFVQRDSTETYPEVDPLWGRGPLSNAGSCADCHPGGGRGSLGADEGVAPAALVVRLAAVEGKDPHQVYGGQFNPLGVPGHVRGEGVVRLAWQPRNVGFAAGDSVDLRAPALRFESLAYGDLGVDVPISTHLAPSMAGLGLLEAVSDETIFAAAAREKPHGIRGRPNLVPDRARGKLVPGRFGHKAAQPNLPQQIMAAFHEDIGLTSSLFPIKNCTASQKACRDLAGYGRPDLPSRTFNAIMFHVRASAPPAPAQAEQPVRGAELFREAACAECHLPALRTGADAILPGLANRSIAAYTDLLLHDMGDALASMRGEFDATGKDWRTAPLWGLGRRLKRHGSADLLHDGRARDATEAILWHGGEASYSRDFFMRLSREERDALLAFLRSL